MCRSKRLFTVYQGGNLRAGAGDWISYIATPPTVSCSDVTPRISFYKVNSLHRSEDNIDFRIPKVRDYLKENLGRGGQVSKSQLSLKPLLCANMKV